MPKRLPRKVHEHLAKARESAVTAVAVYNNPSARFRSGAYIVLMIIAWTALFHAIAYNRGRKPWAVRTGEGKGTRYKRIGNDYMHWNLHECMGFYFGGKQNAIRTNLQFLIGLRDQIEHRNMPDIDHRVFGECQAALFNFEELMVSEFGERYALNTSLTWSLQFSRTYPEERRHTIESRSRYASDPVAYYIDQFHSELATDIANDQRFSFKVFLIPQLANHRSKNTLAVEFVKYDPTDPEAMKDYRQGMALIKERHVAVRNPGELIPKLVVEKVAVQLPWQFKMHHHTQCWRFFDVRPGTKTDSPEKTKLKYCHWDKAFARYTYTEDWVNLLVVELKEAERFEEITGARPIITRAR